MANKARIAAEKATFSGLTQGEAEAFFLMARNIGAEAKYKSVRKYKARFVAEGMLTDAGKLPEHEYRGEHRARFTDKGWALYAMISGQQDPPVIDLRSRQP